MLPRNTTAPQAVVQTHLTAVARIRAALPLQTQAACQQTADREVFDGAGPCGLRRVVQVMNEVTRFQVNYDDHIWDRNKSTAPPVGHLNEYGSRLPRHARGLHGAQHRLAQYLFCPADLALS